MLSNKQEKLLRRSIKKWKNKLLPLLPNTAFIYPMYGDCPLCRVYYHPHKRSNMCPSCPVALFIGDDNCSRVPGIDVRSINKLSTFNQQIELVVSFGNKILESHNLKKET